MVQRLCYYIRMCVRLFSISWCHLSAVSKLKFKMMCTSKCAIPMSQNCVLFSFWLEIHLNIITLTSEYHFRSRNYEWVKKVTYMTPPIDNLEN